MRLFEVVRRAMGGASGCRKGAVGRAVTYALEPMERRLLLAANVIISEFLADNDTGIKDYYNQSSDWIELRNLDLTPRDPSGWHLSDDHANLDKWKFPAGTSIAANGYVLVFVGS